VTPAPFVSVIIPARNEAATMERCLRAVQAQDYPDDRYEVIVADGMSDDGTRRIVSSVAAGDERVTLTDNPARIVPAAMNLGIARCKGEIVVRVDGHTRVAPDYISRCVETLERTGADGAGGVMIPASESTFTRAVALATTSRFGVGNSAFHYARSERESDSIYLGAYPKRTFSRFGGYDEELVRNQDDELNYRIRARGGFIILNPAIRSWYLPRASASALFDQYFQYGWWKTRVMARVPSMIAARHLAPPAFVLALVALLAAGVLHPAALAAAAGALVLHGLLALSFCAINGSPPEEGGAAPARRLPGLVLVPVAALVIHVAYGTGLLLGLFGLMGRPRAGSRRALRTPDSGS